MKAAAVIFAFVVVVTVRDVSASVKFQKPAALDDEDLQIVEEAWVAAQPQLDLPDITICQLYKIVKFGGFFSTRYIVQYDYPDAYGGYYDEYYLFSFTYRSGSSSDYALRVINLDDRTRVSH